MTKLNIPPNYTPPQSTYDTQVAIRFIRGSIHETLEKSLNMMRVSAPLIVQSDTGLNDNLTGVERPVRFDVPELGVDVEIVQSLAKWKRVALKRYGFKPGEGIYTEMNAIRRDDDIDNTHSIYVDQWDWERVITLEERSIDTLVKIAGQLFDMLKETENIVADKFPGIKRHLPSKLTVLSTRELFDLYPNMNANQREDAICRKHGAVFLTQIGDELTPGIKHGDRSPDYDDWTMNGDLLFYYPVLDRAMEISSMGVRVDAAALKSQLTKANAEDRLSLPYHRMVLGGELPLTVGGGLGQSRICMFMLDRAHIGEVQVSVWPEDMVRECEAVGITLL